MMMTKSSYRGYRFPPVIIPQAIWLYARFRYGNRLALKKLHFGGHSILSMNFWERMHS